MRSLMAFAAIFASLQAFAQTSPQTSTDPRVSAAAANASPKPESKPEATPAPVTRGPSFAEAYRTILDRSLRIANSQLDVESTREKKKAAFGRFAPTVAATVEDTQGGEPYDPSTRGAMIGGKINLFRSGSDYAAVRAANRDILRGRENLENERIIAEDEAATTLISFIARVREKQIVDRIVQLKAESLRIARDRFGKGLLSQQEVDQVAIELDNAKARLIDSESREAAARASLQTALGTDSIASDWPWKGSLIQGQRLETVGFEIKNRPDFRAAEAFVETERLRKRDALGDLLPTIDLEGGWGTADLSKDNRRDWRAMFRLTVPLYDGHRGLTRYRLQGIAERVAELSVESLRRSAPAEVEGLRTSFRAARDSALTREKTAQVSERLYSANLQRFRLGRATTNDLALDQSRLLESQLLEIQGWSTAHLSFVKLCHALGGSVDPIGECRVQSSNM